MMQRYAQNLNLANKQEENIKKELSLTLSPLRRERYHSQKEMTLIYLLFNELSTNHLAFPIKTVQIL